MDATPPELKQGGRDLHTEHNTDSPSARPSPSTITEAEESSLASVLSLTPVAGLSGPGPVIYSRAESQA
jgi:hypothetical protein